MNTSAKGRKNEHRGRDFFKSCGYKVVRSAGSFGIADLTCFGDRRILFINGKTNMWAPPEERNELETFVRELEGFGHNVFGVLMRFNDGSKEPQFKVFNKNQWIKIEKEFFHGKSSEVNRQESCGTEKAKVASGKIRCGSGDCRKVIC